MYSSCKRSIHRNTTWSAICISLQRNIPKFDTVLLHSNWSSLRRKYLSKIPTDVNALSCGQKHEKFWEFRTPFPPRDIRKNPRSMYARVPQAMAQFVLKIEIVPHHRDSPNTRNGARLRSPSPIMAPEKDGVRTDYRTSSKLALFPNFRF